MRAVARRQRQILWLALGCAVVLSCVGSLVSPLFEPPDELEHYRFVRYLIDNRRLPVQSLEGEASQSHQPPLYYAVGALLIAAVNDPEEVPERNPFWAYSMAGEVSRDNKQQYLNPDSQGFPFRGTSLSVHLLRLYSVALSLGTVVVTWYLGHTLWPAQPLKVGAMLSLSVCSPMFLYVSGAVNNDNLVILCGATVLWQSVQGFQDGFSWKTTLLLGLVWSCAMLAKITGIICLVAWIVALGAKAWRQRDARLLLSRLAAILGIAAALSGWWFARNFRIYGEPLAMQRMFEVWGAREQLDLTWLWNDFVYAWTTFWGRFAYGQVPLPRVVYWFFLAVAVCAAVGLWMGLRRTIAGRMRLGAVPSAWLTLGATAVAYSASLLYFIIRNPTGANGRYTFPALPALAALLVCGISGVASRYNRFILTGIIVTMIGISVFSLGLYLPWVYSRPTMLSEKEVMTEIQTEQNLTWGDKIELVGTTVASGGVSPGQRVGLTACWKARAAMAKDYVVYVHLADRQLRSLGQRDTYTGLGTYPTSLWQRGDVFCDTYQIPVSCEVVEPVVADLEIGFYELDTRRKLPARTESGLLLERVVLSETKVLPRQAAPTPPLLQEASADFSQGVGLVGYGWSSATIKPGDLVSVTVAWEASGPLDHSYTIFAHMLDSDGQFITQDDGLPRDGLYPTDYWGAGETIIDTRVFSVPREMLPGPTSVLLGFYRLEDGIRLPTTSGSPLPDAARLIGPTVEFR